MLVSKIVEMSLKQLGILASGENADANEIADALESLNGLLAQWATMRLYVHKVNEMTLQLNGSAMVTGIQAILEQATLNNEPIDMVRDLANRDADVVYSVKENAVEFIGNGTLKFKALSLPTDLQATDELHLPSNYKRPLTLSLALEIAPMFGVEPSQTLFINQRQAVDVLKRSNAVPLRITDNSDFNIGVGYCYGHY